MPVFDLSEIRLYILIRWPKPHSYTRGWVGTPPPEGFPDFDFAALIVALLGAPLYLGRGKLMKEQMKGDIFLVRMYLPSEVGTVRSEINFIFLLPGKFD